MTLYQRVAYIRPSSVQQVVPKSTGGGSLGAALVITPREFTNNTYAGPGVFALSEQGLVAMVAADPTSPWGGYYSSAGYRVVTKADGTMDVMTFMEAMAYLTVFGVRDEALSHSARLDLARMRPLEMRCGPTTAFVRGVASTVGIDTRQVHLLNVTSPNYFDDGHVACEARVGGRYRLFDVPTDAAFADSSGDLLSLAEVVQAGVRNTTVVPLAQTRCAPSDAGLALSWNQVVFEMLFHTPELSQDWRARVYEVPGMALPSGGICWGLPTHLAAYKSYVENYPGTGGLWTTMPLADWIAAYY